MSQNYRLFHFSGGREMVNGTKAEALISETAETDPQMIRLSNKSFDFEAAQKIAGKLKSFKNVSVVDISDIIAGKAEDEALKVLETICSSMSGYTIRELNVSDNALGSKGVNVIHSVLCQKSIEKLWICNNGMAHESVELIASILLEGGTAPPLKLFHFYNNMAGDGGATALSTIAAACPHITDFRFSATRAGMNGCLAIAESLSALTELVHLDLNDCNFSKQAGTTLCASLSKMHKLEVLQLRDSNLGEVGVIALLDMIDQSPIRLHKLDISGNDMEEKGWNRLIASLKKPALSQLRELAIDDSELPVEQACALAKSLLHVSQLVQLSLCNDDITAGGALAIATAVCRLQTFHELKIDGNSITENAATKITDMLSKQAKVLGSLEDNDEDGDDDTDEVVDELEEIESMTLPTKPSVVSAVDTDKAAAVVEASVDSLIFRLDHLNVKDK